VDGFLGELRRSASHEHYDRPEGTRRFKRPDPAWLSTPTFLDISTPTNGRGMMTVTSGHRRQTASYMIYPFESRGVSMNDPILPSWTSSISLVPASDLFRRFREPRPVDGAGIPRPATVSAKRSSPAGGAQGGASSNNGASQVPFESGGSRRAPAQLTVSTSPWLRTTRSLAPRPSGGVTKRIDSQ